MQTYSDFVVRSAKSYYSTYESRFLAIKAIENEIDEEKAKVFPNTAKIETMNKMKEYLKDSSNPVSF